jgi:hypothetical protein
MVGGFAGAKIHLSVRIGGILVRGASDGWRLPEFGRASAGQAAMTCAFAIVCCRTLRLVPTVDHAETGASMRVTTEISSDLAQIREWTTLVSG